MKKDKIKKKDLSIKNIINHYQEQTIKIFNNERVIIYHYEKLVMLTDNLIKVIGYEIEGSNLMVMRMNDEKMEIKGQIKTIKIL